MTLDWRDLDSPATLTGSMRAAGTITDVAAWIEQPSALMRSDRSAADAATAFRSTRPDGQRRRGRRGHDELQGPHRRQCSLVVQPDGAFRQDRSPAAPFADLVLNSDALVAVDRAGTVALDLPNLHLIADWQQLRGRARLSGRRHAATVRHARHRSARFAAVPRAMATAARPRTRLVRCHASAAGRAGPAAARHARVGLAPAAAAGSPWTTPRCR